MAPRNRPFQKSVRGNKQRGKCRKHWREVGMGVDAGNIRGVSMALDLFGNRAKAEQFWEFGGGMGVGGDAKVGRVERYSNWTKKVLLLQQD